MGGKVVIKLRKVLLILIAFHMPIVHVLWGQKLAQLTFLKVLLRLVYGFIYFRLGLLIFFSITFPMWVSNPR